MEDTKVKNHYQVRVPAGAYRQLEEMAKAEHRPYSTQFSLVMEKAYKEWKISHEARPEHETQ